MNKVFIGVGSNLGDRRNHINKALAGVRQHIDESARMSRLYETEPRIDEDQPAFLNAVIEATTDLPARALLGRMLELERSLGRQRDDGRPKGPRIIDLDLLAYDQDLINEVGLTVPHPAIADRGFVLRPWAELAPLFLVAGLQSTVQALLAQCPDTGWIRPVTKRTGHKVAALGAVLATLLFAIACDLHPPVQRAAGIDFDRTVRTPFKAPERADNSGTKTPAKDNEVIDILVEKRKELFERPESTVLTQAEALAARSGRQFDMIDIYRKTYDEKGAGHYVAPRLAYAYINIGLNDAARTVVDKLITARPNDWRTWFLHGWLRGTEEKDSRKAVRETVSAWEKALALGPRDKELYGVSRKFLTQRVQEAKAALARDTGGPTSQPSQPVAKDQLAGADKMMSEGNYKGAFVAYSKIAQAEPGNVRALVGKALAGWEAVGDQDRPAALGLLDNIAKRTDLSPQDLDKLGRLYLERVKDPARAKAIWTRLASENPEYAASVKLGERLKDL